MPMAGLSKAVLVLIKAKGLISKPTSKLPFNRLLNV